MGRLAVAVALVGAIAGAGCILPVATGTPLPATTVGRGRLGASISGEAPVLDLLADGDNYSDIRRASSAAPAAAMTLAFAYGLGDDTDLELAGEGALYYFLLPQPSGGSLGIRHHLAATDLFDIALAGKIGGVFSGSSTKNSDGTVNDSAASAQYAAVQAVVQTRLGFVRPLLAVNLMPSRIRRSPVDEPAYRFMGLASSATLGIMMVTNSLQFGPYATITNFTSERFDGGWFPSYGLMLAIRPDRNRSRRAPTIPTTPYVSPPAPYPPPAPAAPAPMGPPGSAPPMTIPAPVPAPPPS